MENSNEPKQNGYEDMNEEMNFEMPSFLSVFPGWCFF